VSLDIFLILSKMGRFVPIPYLVFTSYPFIYYHDPHILTLKIIGSKSYQMQTVYQGFYFFLFFFCFADTLICDSLDDFINLFKYISNNMSAVTYSHTYDYECLFYWCRLLVIGMLGQKMMHKVYLCILLLLLVCTWYNIMPGVLNR